MTQEQAIALAAAYLGGKGKLCSLLGLKRQAIHNWRRAGRVPLNRAVEIERLTEGRVTLAMLRPDYDLNSPK
jgi:DNA-binding transcriptional regulator YdaS (Cro superfamily)